jgi:hypothetical protein
MKYFLTLLATIAFLTVNVGAQQTSKSTDAKGGTDVGNTLCYAILSTAGEGGKAPVITYLNATSDKAGSIIQFYTCGQVVSASHGSTTVSVPVNATNGFTAADIIIIRHGATDTYERRILDTFTSATNLTTTVAPSVALVPGDIIYKAVVAGTIPVGAATKELNGVGIYAGEKGKPLLLEIDGTSSCQINAVCAKYE